MADKKISDLPDGDSTITGAQGRVDVPVVVSGTTYQVDQAVLAKIPVTGAVDSAVPFGSALSPVMVADGQLQFISDIEDGNLSALGVFSFTEAQSVVNGDTVSALILEGPENEVEVGNTALAHESSIHSIGDIASATMYATATAGRPLYKLKPNSSPTNNVWLQPAWFGNMVYIWRVGPGINGTSLGFTNVTGSGTFAFTSATNTNRYTTNRGTYANVVTTTNQSIGLTTNPIFFRGGGSGVGGFFYYCRFGFENYKAGDRLFIGMNGFVGTDPSTQGNLLGFAMDAADSVITFMHNDAAGSATKDAIAGQPTVASGQGYDAYIYLDPYDNSTVYYRLDDLNARTTIIDTSTASDLPVVGTALGARQLIGNAANTAAGDANLGLMTLYVEVPN